MPISESTVKRLFAKSHNQCAMPRCTSPLIIGEHVLGEICHIRARRKTGARYDPNLSPEQRDSFGNLILLCPTCHTLADKAPGIYTAELLGDIKEIHERDAPLEITAEVARQALMIFEKHRLKKTNSIRRSSVKSQTQATATAGGIAIAIGGHNQGPITVNLPKKNTASGPRYPANSIGADANMTNYIEYLCDLYVKYMALTGATEDELWARIGKQIKSKFRLKKRTRNHLSSERFLDLVDFLIYEKLTVTPVGKKHLRNGTKLCLSFDEFRRAV